MDGTGIPTIIIKLFLRLTSVGNGLENWMELSGSALDAIWMKMEEDLSFKPYSIEKVRKADLFIDLKMSFDFVDPINRGDFIRSKVCKIIEQNRMNDRVVLLDWHHPSFEFFGDEFQFPAGMDFPPNGDYLFIFVSSVNSWVFCDGIDEGLHVYGESLRAGFELMQLC